MFRNTKSFHPDALIGTENFRSLVESFESELLRGINTLAILSIIKRHGKIGIYGYQIIKELEQETNNLMIIEEGTLYPLLRKLEKEKVLNSHSRTDTGRLRKYYTMTEMGLLLHNHLMGFFAKLMESSSSLMYFKVTLESNDLYCPNCANHITLDSDEINFCNICGYPLSNIKQV